MIYAGGNIFRYALLRVLDGASLEGVFVVPMVMLDLFIFPVIVS